MILSVTKLVSLLKEAESYSRNRFYAKYSLKRKRGIGLWDKCFDIYSSNKYPKIKFRIFSEILVHCFFSAYAMVCKIKFSNPKMILRP